MAIDTSPLPENKTVESAFTDTVIRLLFLGLLAYWVGILISPFVVLIVWAVVLTVAVYPFFTWLRDRLGGRGKLASFIITLIGLAIILGPTIYLSTSLAETMQALSAKMINGTLYVAHPPQALKSWPMIGEMAYDTWLAASNNLSQFLHTYSSTILGFSAKITKSVAGIGGGILGFAFSIIISGFLYGNGPSHVKSLSRFASRVISSRGEEFIQLAGATIRNVARGVIGIAIVQTALVGIGLIMADIPGVALITAAVLILGLIQIGPGVILLPVVIWSWTTLEPMTAILFSVYMIPVGLMDNILKPIIMAKGLKTPMLVIFVGVIGGTLAHGLIGLFLGPIILAIFYELLTAWIATGKDTPQKGASE